MGESNDSSIKAVRIDTNSIEAIQTGMPLREGYQPLPLERKGYQPLEVSPPLSPPQSVSAAIPFAETPPTNNDSTVLAAPGQPQSAGVIANEGSQQGK